jgi:hypothetical protein
LPPNWALTTLTSRTSGWRKLLTAAVIALAGAVTTSAPAEVVM